MGNEQSRYDDEGDAVRATLAGVQHPGAPDEANLVIEMQAGLDAQRVGLGRLGDNARELSRAVASDSRREA